MKTVFYLYIFLIIPIGQGGNKLREVSGLRYVLINAFRIVKVKMLVMVLMWGKKKKSTSL